MAKCHTNLHHFKIKFGFVLAEVQACKQYFETTWIYICTNEKL